MSALKPGCTARVLDVPGAMQFAGRVVEVKTIAQEHDCKNFEGEGAYVWAPGFGWWFPTECLEWVSDEPPVWPPRYDDEEDDGCEDCEELRAENARLAAENKGLADLAEDAIDGRDGQAAIIEHLTAERDSARASITRVEALAAEWDGLLPTIAGEMVDLASVIRAAISEDVPHGR